MEIKNRFNLTILALLTLAISLTYPQPVVAAARCGSIDSYSKPVPEWEPEQSELNGALATIVSRNNGIVFEEAEKIINSEPSQVVPIIEAAGTKINKMDGAAWEAAIINALADIISDRAEKEVEVWILSDMLEKICSNSQGISGKEYLPNLCGLHEQFDASLLPTRQLMISTVQKDLELLPARYLCKKYDTPVGMIVTNLIKQAAQSDSPERLLAGLGTRDLYNDWLGNTQITDHENRDLLTLYLVGLATQSYLEAFAINGNQYLLEYTTDIFNNKFAAEIRDGSRNPISQADLTAVITLLKDIKSRVENIKELNAKEKPDYASILKEASLLSKDMLAIIKTIGVNVDHDKVANIEVYLRKMDFLADALTGRYQDGLVELGKMLECSNSQENKGCRYIPALLSLASVNNAEEAKSVLESLASPVGAWRLKKTGQIEWSVGALAGLSYGYEVFRDNHADPGVQASIFVPLGLDWNFEDKPKLGVIDGIFFSALNFGNLVSQRLTNKEDGEVSIEENHSVRFSDIFSPGVYLRNRLGNSPFVMTLGASYNFQLRETDDAAGNSSRHDTIQANIGLAVDVTLFPLK